MRRSFAVAVVLITVACSQAEAPFSFPAKKLDKGQLLIKDGLPLLIVEGTPEEIGEQTALLAVKPGKKALEYPADLMKKLKLHFLWPVLINSGEKMYKHFPADYQKEFETIVKKSGVDREAILAGNTMFDIMKMMACSTVTIDPDQSETKGPLFGRNLDYPTLGYVDDYSLITIYKPKGKHAFASLGFPGIIGCLSGMNDAGLALTVNEVLVSKDPEEKFDSKGIPYALCYRQILEECSTVDEAETLLKKLKRSTTTCLTICDKKTCAVFEVTPKRVIRRGPEAGVCVCTNHFLSKEIKPAKQSNFADTLDRFDTLCKVRDIAKDRKVEIKDIHKALDDANLGSLTMQTMIFEPAALKLHVAFGPCPSSANKLKTLELADLLKK